ncbi:LAME_0H02146g1_1 [Lachancea meyersii CBS 8951]|uniref:LAME_0H02146g1_1 n=1 Tax=Lachancea meyersii CBS 8951 TaxID=1266667 RepID=A0A1G4KDC3_9SACH|nr:LAME_0H02146g1_1 [Lachancea meyersii CBS 8951]
MATTFVSNKLPELTATNCEYHIMTLTKVIVAIVFSLASIILFWISYSTATICTKEASLSYREEHSSAKQLPDLDSPKLKQMFVEYLQVCCIARAISSYVALHTHIFSSYFEELGPIEKLKHNMTMNFLFLFSAKLNISVSIWAATHISE